MADEIIEISSENVVMKNKTEHCDDKWLEELDWYNWDATITRKGLLLLREY